MSTAVTTSASKVTSHPENPERIKPAIGVVTDGVYITGGLGNSLSIDLGDSVVQIDTGYNAKSAQAMMAQLAKYTSAPVTTLVYSHGHLGYNFGVTEWVKAAIAAGRSAPPILAQAAAMDTIDRFRTTSPFAHLALALKMHGKLPENPGQFPITNPTATFTDSYSVLGSERSVSIVSAPSETSGAIAAWIPDAGVLYGGPSCITALPNIGLPLRTPRDPVRWANTLERLAGYRADHLVPQYGPVIHGQADVREYLESTVRALRYVHDEVLRLLNEGYNLNQLSQCIEFPAEIFAKTNLEGNYGSLSDLVHAIWSSYVGWWDRNPTNLQPAPEGDVAAAVLAAIGDPQRVLDHVESLCAQGSWQLALHVVDLIALAEGDAPEVVAARQLKAKICRAMAGLQGDFAGEALYLSSADIIEEQPPMRTGVR